MKVIKFITSNTNIKESDIVTINSLPGGFSNNDNYYVLLKDQSKLQVRLSKQDIDHINEIKADQLYKSIYLFVDNKGNMIKKWINGTHPDLANRYELIKVLEEIRFFHTLPKQGFDKHGIDFYLNTTKLVTYLDEFKDLIKLYNQEDEVLIHGDINNKNIIIQNDKVTLIDLEWARTGPSIIDYASLVAFSNADIFTVMEFIGCEKNKMIKFIRLILIHTLMWCETQKTNKAEILHKFVKKQLNNYV